MCTNLYPWQKNGAVKTERSAPARVADHRSGNIHEAPTVAQATREANASDRFRGQAHYA